MTPKEVTRIILQALKKPNAPERNLIEEYLKRWKENTLNHKEDV
tara:strand:+ start:63 stop:194 length:132 start_codon:yes stop_codon:yes gene_type:complete